MQLVVGIEPAYNRSTRRCFGLSMAVSWFGMTEPGLPLLYHLFRNTQTLKGIEYSSVGRGRDHLRNRPYPPPPPWENTNLPSRPRGGKKINIRGQSLPPLTSHRFRAPEFEKKSS